MGPASFAFLEQLEDGGHGAEARPLLPSLHPRPPVDLLVRHRGLVLAPLYLQDEAGGGGPSAGAGHTSNRGLHHLHFSISIYHNIA